MEQMVAKASCAIAIEQRERERERERESASRMLAHCRASCWKGGAATLQRVQVPSLLRLASHTHHLPRVVSFSYTPALQQLDINSPAHVGSSNWNPQPVPLDEIVPSPPPHADFYINAKFLDCSEPQHKLKVGVLLSGGVDSSVALRLLCAAGHSCTAFYLKIWFQEDFENFWASCPWDEDLKFAKAVCDQVGVELHVVQLTEAYWKNVVSYMIAEYQLGRTPNPDVLCNTRIKFGVFLEHIDNMGFDRVASGHYAKVVRSTTGAGGTQAVLHLSKDEVKDQTYFLSHLSQSQLLRLIFPLGSLSKGEVRQLADEMGLPNKQRKDSQGICFLGKVRFSDFICRHLGEREGRILEAETGNYLGSHKGYWFYTIGQRQGLRLSNGPWYVVDKDLENNVVFVSREYFSVDKKRRTFEIHSLNWLGGNLPTVSSKLRCKVRHGPRFYDCNLTFNTSQSNPVLEGTSNSTSALVQLSEDDQGIAAGQYAVFYEGDVCLGSGVIGDSLGDKSSSVSMAARAAAMVKDIPLVNERESKKKKLKTDEKIESSSKPPGELGWITSLQKLLKKYFSWLGPR